jgi:cation transport ATPase
MTPYDPEDERYHTHLLTLLSVSSAMVGVCLTAIGLIGILKALDRLEIVVDELLSLGTLLFMAVSLLSFLGIRTGLRQSWKGLPLTIDVLFCLGLLVLAIASVLLAWVVL